MEYVSRASSDYFRTNPSLFGSSRLLSASSGWFFIQILVSLNFSTISAFEKHGITFRTKDMVDVGWYRMFLTSEKFNLLNESPFIKLYNYKNDKYSIKKVRTLYSEEIKSYLIHTSPDWEPKNPLLGYKRISDQTAVIYGTDSLDELIEDEKILRIQPHKSPKLENRYTAGYLQTNSQEGKFVNGQFIGPRPLHEKGLTGKGQVVSVVDSGLDHLHCMFYDPNVPTPFNKTDPNHRKILRYDSMEDGLDPYGGHGSHVCGIIAGNAHCGRNCTLSLYNGVAPEAKLHMYDLGDLKQGAGHLGDVDLRHYIPQMKMLDSHISSNSWGFDDFRYNTYEFCRVDYDNAAFENPDILFVFAAGNSAQPYTINIPGNGKNVIAAGALVRPYSANYESRNVVYYLVADKNYQIKIANFGSEPYNLLKHDPPILLENRYVVIYEGENHSNFEGSFVFISDTNQFCEKVKIVEQNNGIGVLVGFDPLTCISTQLVVVYLPEDLNKFVGKTISIESKLTGNPTAISRASLSSQGPGNLNYIKPDLSAPGELILSASAGYPSEIYPRSCAIESAIRSKSGTSMATPAISGVMAIIRQYFTDGWYPYQKPGTGTKINPTSALLRAVATNSAHKVSSYISTGFGVPVIQEALALSGGGIRVIDGKVIKSESHHVYVINTQNTNMPLSITMSYLDPALAVESKLPLFAFLNLLVVTPSKKVYYGNGKQDVPATAQRVIVLEEYGKFEIHVISSKYPMDKDIPYAIAITGSFEQTDLNTNPAMLEYTTPKTCGKICKNGGDCINGRCKCKGNYFGIGCELEFREVYTSEKVTFSVDFQETKYYKFYIGDNSSFDLTSSYATGKQHPVLCFAFSKPDYPDELNNQCFKPASAQNNKIKFLLDQNSELMASHEVYMSAYSVTPTKTEMFFIAGNIVEKPIQNFLISVPLWVFILVAVVVGLMLIVIIVFVIIKIKNRRKTVAADLEVKLNSENDYEEEQTNLTSDQQTNII